MRLRKPHPLTHTASAVAGIAFLALGACHHARNGFDDTHAVELAMQDYAHALLDSSLDTVAARYTPDGELVLPGMPPLHGPAAIRAFLAPLVRAVHVDSVSLASDRVALEGRDAHQWGRYHQVAGERGKPAQSFDGGFEATWRLDAHGHWKIARMVMTPTPRG